MATTALHPHGLPGKPHSFSAKDSAPVGGPHNPGWITALAVHGLPGGVHTFSPKTPAAGGGPHNPGHITALSVMALPGGLHSFIAKAAVPRVPPTRRQFYKLEGSGCRKWRRYYIEEN